MTKSLDCASCSHLPGCMPCAVLQACSFTIQIAMVLFSRVTIEWGVCRYSRLALDPWPRSQCARLCGCSSPSFSARPSHNTIISHRQRGALQKSMLNGFGEDTAQLGCKNIADLCARHLHLSLIFLGSAIGLHCLNLLIILYARAGEPQIRILFKAPHMYNLELAIGQYECRRVRRPCRMHCWEACIDDAFNIYRRCTHVSSLVR